MLYSHLPLPLSLISFSSVAVSMMQRRATAVLLGYLLSHHQKKKDDKGGDDVAFLSCFPLFSVPTSYSAQIELNAAGSKV